MTEFTIRKATLDDVDAILNMRHDFCVEDKHDFDRDGTKRIVLEIINNQCIGEINLPIVDGKIAGYCFFAHTYSIEFNGKDAWLDELYIAPAFRAIGIGSKIIDFVKARTAELGASYLHLEAMDDNVKVHPYYRRHGLKQRASRHYVMPLKEGLPSTV